MSGVRILVVEDDPSSRKLLRDVLMAVGYEVLESGTAEDGLKLARESRPSLILMDIRLPGMSGIDALGLLRKDPATRRIPVVAVTASVMRTQKALALEAGFDALEQKPVRVSALLETMRRILGGESMPRVT